MTSTPRTAERCKLLINEWKKKKHINQTGGINRGNQKKRFINSGIDTIDKLAKLNPKTKIQLF